MHLSAASTTMGYAHSMVIGHRGGWEGSTHTGYCKYGPTQSLTESHLLEAAGVFSQPFLLDPQNFHQIQVSQQLG